MSQDKTLREIVRETQDDIREIMNCLKGSKLQPEGLVKKIADQERRLTRVEKVLIRYAAIGGVLVFLLNIIALIIIKIV